MSLANHSLIKRSLQTLIVAMVFAVPSMASAASLSSPQISAILDLLRAFNAEESLIASVAGALAPAPSPDPLPAAASSSPVVPLTRPDTSGSPYTPSHLGYDLSFNSHDYPQIGFGFAVVGVTAGKAFTHNERAYSEYSFAQFGSTRPTLYLNLNAPYGKSASSVNLSTPRTCDTLFGATTTSASAGGTYPEPTVCASYNYGFNTAKDAFVYATSVSVASPLWWIDIEEANSWSDDAAVNDSVIQGAIDYLNTQNIRVGVYSVPYMWHNIVGDSFSPTQSLGGKSVTTPTWFPIGIATQVRALNTCLTHNNPLIPGSPVWIIQYEADSTAVDQNIAC